MDRISNLNDDLLLQILSLVPTITVFSAQLLSKRWRNLWRKLQSLHYDYTYHSCDSQFLIFIKTTMELLEYPVLQRLYLRISPSFGVKIRKNLLAKRSVRELNMISTSDGIKLKKAIYEFETLVILRLECFGLADHYGKEISLRCLTVLELRRTKYTTDESLSNLLSSLPSLKDLFLDQCLSVQHTRTVTTLSIVVPSLKRLRVLRCPASCRNQFMVLNVNSSSLEYLNVEDYWRNVSFSNQKLEELIEADINVSHTNTWKLLKTLTSLRRLSLCIITSKIPPIDALFDQLVHLEICTCQHEWWNILERVLFDSPKLRVLKLHQKHSFGITDPTVRVRWEERSFVPVCFASHLERFEWRDYEGTEAEKELASYILRNTGRLKIATIYPVISHQDQRMHQILKDNMRQELENLSGCCFTSKLVFI